MLYSPFKRNQLVARNRIGQNLGPAGANFQVVIVAIGSDGLIFNSQFLILCAFLAFTSENV